jgi:hypothetical protein
MRRLRAGLLVLVLASLAPALYAADWWAAPAGSATAAGTQAAPWDLHTALKDARVKPGDTVFLRGGTYRGKFTSTLTGTPAAPITVRSAPGEWVEIDGFATTTLTATIDATTQTVTLADASAFPEGSPVTIDNEQLSLLSKSGNRFTFAQRGLNGTARASHTAGTLVVLGGNQLTVRGADTVYRDFEVLCSDPMRVGGNSQNGPRLRGAGIWHDGLRTRLVNVVIHDGDVGIFGSGRGLDTEVYGCLVYNNGYKLASGVMAGDGVYGQNTSGRKRFEDLIVFNNFRMGMKEESQSGNTIGMDHVGIIGFNNGSPANTVNREPSLFAGANNGRADDIVIRECLPCPRTRSKRTSTSARSRASSGSRRSQRSRPTRSRRR